MDCLHWELFTQILSATSSGEIQERYTSSEPAVMAYKGLMDFDFRGRYGLIAYDDVPYLVQPVSGEIQERNTSFEPAVMAYKGLMVFDFRGRYGLIAYGDVA
ncbi:hypothetical protein CDAR_402311 [Caerostris darwini]|uniref:Uncharacterized protein n=1 Tax=Caerostris darwini TaxID=1538125 RepID=A0AAV4P9C2_9ARAC|nr:hypothetical protein CDAR_402311 [Caerostris darwini]